MTYIVLIFLVVAVLLVLFVWALRTPRWKAGRDEPTSLEQNESRHATYVRLVRQALSHQDFEYVASRGGKELSRRVQRERRRVALAYLIALRGDFRRLVRLARVIAALSPEVEVAHELERLQLTVQFCWRFEFIRLRLLCNLTSLPQLLNLSDMVSGLTVRLEAAMKELGERAGLASEIASSLDRSGLDIV